MKIRAQVPPGAEPLAARPLAARPLAARGAGGPLQARAAPDRSAIAGARTHSLDRLPVSPPAARPAPPNRTGLPGPLKAGVEALSGLSLDAVRVHANSALPARLGALAYARGTDIHLGPGQERHLPHEAWHVVQQARGQVRPMARLKTGIAVNDDAGLERAADVMGRRAEHLGASPSWSPPGAPLARAAGGGGPVQRVVAQSDWMRISRQDVETDEASSSSLGQEKKGGQAKREVIEISRTFGGDYQACTDKTSEAYRNRAEGELGALEPLGVLAKHGVIPRSSVPGANPLARSHLIAAEFGGQLKFRNPGDNIRFHPRDLEWGDWQRAETHIKTHGVQGYLTVRSTESFSAAGLAREIVATLRGHVSQSVISDLNGALVEKLRAANYVPISVHFKYTDVADRAAGLDMAWGDQTGVLAVQRVEPGKVWAALKELGLVRPGVADPEGFAAAMATPTARVDSREALVTLLKTHLGGKDTGRKRIVCDSLNKLMGNVRITGDKFAEQIKKLPELKDENLRIAVVDTFHDWKPLEHAEIQGE